MKNNSKSRIIEYPTIRVSQCRHYDSNVHPYGVRYCPVCNCIILGMALFSKKEAEEEIVDILNHETTHWWLCKHINEETSIGFDVMSRMKNELINSNKTLPFDFTLLDS